MTSREYVRWGKVADGLKQAARRMREHSVPVLEPAEYEAFDTREMQREVQAQQEAVQNESF